MAKKTQKTTKVKADKIEINYTCVEAEITAVRHDENGQVVGKLSAKYNRESNYITFEESTLAQYRKVTPDILERYGNVLIEMAKVARSNAKF